MLPVTLLPVLLLSVWCGRLDSNLQTLIISPPGFFYFCSLFVRVQARRNLSRIFRSALARVLPVTPLAHFVYVFIIPRNSRLFFTEGALLSPSNQTRLTGFRFASGSPQWAGATRLRLRCSLGQKSSQLSPPRSRDFVPSCQGLVGKMGLEPMVLPRCKRGPVAATETSL